ncbi:hypothetical protein Dsin_013817 [Dipteronia sinensis]|uniref:Uncharacterized protein n=1 Tax=Dipteronia sinensis TaxID=43782 RepID=A0AAE0E9T1_9ROSI|nr:hypothetical protein Dsin_013817 [Dipteronia sinensis]
MQAGGVGLTFAQSGDNRLDPCVLIPCNKVGHKFFLTSEKQFLQLQSSDSPECQRETDISRLSTSCFISPLQDLPSSMSQAVLKDMSHLPGKQPPPWRTQAQPNYQEEGNSDKKGDKCGTNTNSVYKAVVKAPASI